jgi:hypothetical protein
MGVKTVVAALNYAASHRAAATAVAQNVDSLHREILLQATDLMRDLQILVGSMQTGDSNIATVNAQIAALS